MASLLRLASFATLFVAALSLPKNEPRHTCNDFSCNAEIGTPPALNMSALCSPTGPGYCNFGAYFSPSLLGSQNEYDAQVAIPKGDVNLYIFNNDCNVIGNFTSAYSASDYSSPLKPFDSELPMVVQVNTFVPSDGYGHGANIQFSYSTYGSKPLWNARDTQYNDFQDNSDDYYCVTTQSSSSGGAYWLQVRIDWEPSLFRFFPPLTCSGVISISAQGTLQLPRQTAVQCRPAFPCDSTTLPAAK